MTVDGKNLRAPAGPDLGLNTAEEARARVLHHDSIIVDLLAQHIGGSNLFLNFPATLLSDLHSRTKVMQGIEALTETEYWPYEMARQGKSDQIQQWYRSSGLTCGTYCIGVHDGADPDCLKLDQVNTVLSALPWLRCVTTAEEIRRAKRDGVTALYAHWQPVNPAPRNLGAIDAAYGKGLRSFMLTYNQMDNIGVGCTERVDAGLSLFGVSVVHHCNDIGLIVDVSHCGYQTTLDACRHSRKPVNANHTAARGVFAHARGKSDEELKAIADTGGVIGVVALPAFLTADPVPHINHMLEHIDYIANLIGWQHVALGTDWPMQVPMELVARTLEVGTQALGFRPEHRLDWRVRLEGYEDGRDLVNITRGLVARGYRDEQIQGILGENALRVFAEVCD